MSIGCVEFLKDPKERNVFIGVLLLHVVLFALIYNRGWHVDDGYFMAPALDIAAGATPHVDIEINHPGLIYYWHWLCFQIFGTSILATRIVWAVACVIQSGMWYLTARMLFDERRVAVLTTLLMTFTGPWAYFTSNPTWWAFWFLSAALLCLLCGIHSAHQNRWRLAGGVSLGLAFLMKQSIGIFGIFAAVLCVFFQAAGSDVNTKQAPASWERALLWALQVLFSAGILAYGMAHVGMAGPVFFQSCVMLLLPVILLAVALLNTVRRNNACTAENFPKAALLYLAGGVIVPCVAAAIFMISRSGMAGLEMAVDAIFIKMPKLLALHYLISPPPQIFSSQISHTFGLILAFALMLTSNAPGFWLLLLALVTLSGETLHPAYWAWQAWAVLIVGRTFTGWVISLWLLRTKNQSVIQNNAPFLFVFCFACFGYFVTFPVAYFNYQPYGVCFAVLAAFAFLWQAFPQRHRMITITLALSVVACFVFMPAQMMRGGHHHNGQVEIFNPLTRFNQPLSASHPEIFVDAFDAAEYNTLENVIKNNSSGKNDLLVLPDNSELYFLNGKLNPMPFYQMYPSLFEHDQKLLSEKLATQRFSLVILPHLQNRPEACESFFTAMSTPTEMLEILQKMIAEKYAFAGNTACYDVYAPSKNSGKK